MQPPSEAEAHLSRDPILAALLSAGGPLGGAYEGRSHFETAARIVASQQVSEAAASTIWSRVRALVPRFTPKAVLALTPEALRGAGLSGSKAKTIQGLADALLSKEVSLSALSKRSDDEVIESLKALKGFGPWSAQMMLLFGYARPDVFSFGDAGLRRGLVELYGLEKEGLEEAAVPLLERWQPHRSMASRLLWRYLGLPKAQRVVMQTLRTWQADAEAWAYLVLCGDGSIYSGYTTDLSRRITAHQSGKGAKYTAGRGPIRLLYAEPFDSKSAAMKREVALKKLSKSQKETLSSQPWDGAGLEGIAAT